MEDLQIQAGKRNIVNTYVWDADGGLRTESQSFANTVEHTVGGSFSMEGVLGFESDFDILGANFELTAQATVHCTQTMTKTEQHSRALALNIDLSGVEGTGVTDYNDNPILPGEKVGRYRFMSFYLEGDTQHFNDFFAKVVDPEWLQSNSEEARALRQIDLSKPNKTWRVLHRVTYVERPALMGFGQDTRALVAGEAAQPDIADTLALLQEKNAALEAKLDMLIGLLAAQAHPATTNNGNQAIHSGTYYTVAYVYLPFTIRREDAKRRRSSPLRILTS
jgi:hypothetical protein